MIRFDSDLNKRINRVVSQFNAKVNRLAAQNATHLPKLIDESLLRAKYSNRNLLLRELKQLESFTRPGAEEIITSASGVRMSKWEFERSEQDRIYALKNITHALNKNTYQGSNLEKTLRSQQHFLRNQSMRSNFAARSRQESEANIRKIKSISKHLLSKVERDALFKKNLMDMIEKGFSEGGMSRESIESIIGKLDQLSPAQLAQAYHDNINIRNFIEAYAAFAQYDFLMSDKENDVVDTFENMKNLGIEFQQNIDKTIEEIQNGVVTVDTPNPNTTFFEF